MAATDTPRRKLVRPLGSCVRFVTICRNLSRFTRPGGGHELFEVTNSIANAGSFEMHPAIEAM
jgi:hypothetical protein